MVFRSGPDAYELWSPEEYRPIPVISVAPVRRPRLDVSGKIYCFDDEREMMKDKIRTVLRIAAYNNLPDLCMGAFGVGPVFRNPVREVAEMLRSILFSEKEFDGFKNIVFAIEPGQVSQGNGKMTDYQVFQSVFDAQAIMQWKASCGKKF